ncbi:MAG TPA: 50S ribosomal protein L10 [Dehalococcoidia bacterium]|nr:50S ribosomal protein L10 [Dehalococcoidia bacterium]
MPKPEKIATVQDLKARLQRATLAIGAQYRGLRVAEMTDLRRRLRAAGLEIKVVKNTLLRLAAEEAGRPEVTGVVEGPTALVLGYDDPIASAKAVTDYAATAPAGFRINAAFIDGTIASGADLRDLVSLPPKPVMLSMIMGQLQSPLANTVGLLQAPLQEFSMLLQSLVGELPSLIEARARQMESA